MMNSEKKVRLLVCDPDPQGRKMINEFLRGSSIDVIFTTPSAAFENLLCEHSPFNAVVIDLSNRTQRCRDLISAVKQISPGAEIIFLSRLADESLWSEVLGLGAYDLLPKPTERAEFLRTVLGAIQKQHAA